MALASAALEGLIVSKLAAAGFDVSNEHAQIKVLANAIAEAVVEHITAAADVAVTSGSSAGSYKVA